MSANNTINPSAVIDLTAKGTQPDDLVKMFQIKVDNDEKCEREPIKTDIDITAHPYSTDDVNPKSFNLVNISPKGAVALDKYAVIRYLRACRVVYCGQTPYIFDGRIYVQIDDASIARLIYSAVETYSDKPFLSKTTINDLIAMLRATSQEIDIDPPKDFDEMAYDGTIVPFQNGLYNVNTDTLLPFTPWLFVTHQLDAIYDPSIQNDKVEEVYRKILPDERTLDFFFQMVGYSLFSERLSPPAIFLIYGPGNTGKSALQKAVETAAGLHNVSSLDLAQISGNFTTAELQGKLINICGETGSGQSREMSKVDGELLKKLSDGQAITVQRKYGHPYQMCNTAKLWFITNSPPDFGDTSSGLYRRLYIIPCRREQNWEDQIYEKLTTHEAICWLINKAVQAYRNFIDNGCRFRVSAEMQYELRTYKTQDGLMDFFEYHFGTSDKTVVGDKLNGLFIADIYDEYSIYIKNGGGHPLSRRKMSEKIRNEYNLKTETTRTFQADGKATNRVKFIK